MHITMSGHRTVLIEPEGARGLTDRCFGAWGDPACTRGMRRKASRVGRGRSETGKR